MSEFEDSNLSGEIGRLAGESPDAGAAFAVVTTRVRRARRRRAAAWSGGAMAAVAVIAVAASFGGGESRLENTPATQPEITVTDSTDLSVPTSTDATLPEVSVPTTPDPSTSSTVAPPAVTSPPSTQPVSTQPPTTRPPSTTQPPTTQPPSPPVTSTFGCVGGSATVRATEGVLTIVATSPNSGWVVAETGGDDDEVEVRFEQSELESRLRVGLLGDTMVPSCEETSDD